MPRLIGKENNYEQNVPRRSFRDAGRKSPAHGKVLPRCIWLADAAAWGGDGQLRPCHDHRTDDSGPKKPGAINGGFFPKKPEWPAQHPSVVIAVDDIKAAIRKVAEAGGKV